MFRRHHLSYILLFFIIFVNSSCSECLHAHSESTTLHHHSYDQIITDYKAIYYVDHSGTDNSNSTCKDKQHPCANLDLVIQAARKELSDMMMTFKSFQTTSLNGTESNVVTTPIIGTFRMVVESPFNLSKFSSSLPFDFSEYCEKLELDWIGHFTTFSLLHKDSKVEKFYMNGGIMENFSTLSVSNALGNVKIENCTGVTNIYTEIRLLEIEHCNFFQLLIQNNIRNIQLTNTRITFFNLFSENYQSIVKIENSHIIGHFKLQMFELFSVSNSIWMFDNSLSEFKLGRSILLSNITTNSRALFMLIDNLKLDNVLVNGTNNDFQFYQMINVDTCIIQNCTFTNNLFSPTNTFMSLQMVTTLMIEDTIYAQNNGGWILFTEPHQNIFTSVYLTNTIVRDNQNQDALLQFIDKRHSFYQVHVKNCHFLNNGGIQFSQFGSCLFLEGGLIDIEDSIFSNNGAILGGAVYTSNCRVTVKNCSFIQNFAKIGGAMFYLNSNSELENVHCNKNTAMFAGGCIYSDNIEVETIGLNGNSSGGSYGNMIAYPLKTIKLGMNGIFENDTLVYPGQLFNLDIYVMDISNQVAIFLMDSSSLLIQPKNITDAYLLQDNMPISNNGSLRVGLQIRLLVPSIRKVPIVVKVYPDIVAQFEIEISSCPYGYKLIDKYGVFECVYLPMEIILPSAILGFISLLIIIGALSYGTMILARKIIKLQKQENAEKDIERKLNDKQFIFETSEESALLVQKTTSDSINSSESVFTNNKRVSQYIIPISEIDIVKRIGEGSFGQVYLARWNRTEVAIKKLKYETEDNEEFEKEAILMSSLRHPSIVSCFGVSITTNAKYMVVEYMDGGSLEKILYLSNQGKNILKFNIKLRILINVAKGLTYLHSIKPHKIIHRDLKSANILLDSNMNAKVCDFGLSKVVSNSHTMTSQIGTLLYCCPEILSNQGYKGQSTKLDIYSFSIVMWELMFEKTPFSEELGDIGNPFSILINITKGQRPKLLFGHTFENVTNDWIEHNFTKKQIQSFGREKIIEYLVMYVKLMEKCWAQDASQRPEFIEIVDYLENMNTSLFSDI